MAHDSMLLRADCTMRRIAADALLDPRNAVLHGGPVGRFEPALIMSAGFERGQWVQAAIRPDRVEAAIRRPSE